MYNEVNNKRKFIIPAIIAIITIIIIVIVVGLLTKTQSSSTEKTEITILVVPLSATIKIDNETYQNGTYEIAPGEHTANISATGFLSKEVNFIAEKNKIALLYEYLTPATEKYSSEDYSLLRYISKDKETDKLVKSYFETLAFLDRLPIINDEKKVYITDQSYSDKCNQDPYICIGITNLGTLSKSETVELIREKGYNPDDFVIFYEEGTSNYYDGE